MLNARKNVPDLIFTAGSVLYLVLPVIIFFFGWLNYYISVPVSFVFMLFAWSLYRELSAGSCELICKNSAKFWLITLICIIIWVTLSGIGGVCHQNSDFIARNAIYRDLCNYEWPVIYDLSAQSEVIQGLLGTSKAALSYYFSWWLVPALVSKIFAFGQVGQDICIYAWALTGVFLAFYNLCRHFGKNSFAILAVFIFFSGLDIIGAVLHSAYSQNWWGGGILGLFSNHIEWWAKYFQYSSNTTILFWVFNQAIPLWVLMSLLLQLRDSKNQIALSSLIFAYSTWAAIGIIPIVLAYTFTRTKDLRKIFSFQNILLPLCMLIFYGGFYLTCNVHSHKAGGFTLTSMQRAALYVLFVILEFGIYFIVMGKNAVHYELYYVVLAELLLIPCYEIIDFNFTMRASLPALFVLMTFLIRSLSDLKGIRRTILIIVMIIGAWTPMNEINRSIKYTGVQVLNEAMRVIELPDSIASKVRKYQISYRLTHSTGMLTINDLDIIKLYAGNFFANDYPDSAFCKYFGK